MHNVSAPDSFSVTIISFTFPGLCGMMVTPSFLELLALCGRGVQSESHK